MTGPSLDLLTGPAQPAVSVRRVRPADGPELAAFYAALSPESRRARFLGYSTGIDEEMSHSFCRPDHMHAEGFVARLPGTAGEEGPLVGHLCLEPAGPRRSELAVAVADDQQHRGIGRALFEAALAWAEAHGQQAILASAFADNGRVLRLLSSAPHPCRILPADGGVVDVIVPLVLELPRDLTVVAPLRRRRRRLAGTLRPRCHAVWRRRPPPAPAAGGSASKESS
ncbi:MAG TPA: GNAT family N-acetyltransferase [Candidatus Limnocylindria bacterium]|nr:GNAT family N-acetyltransferase [Candidatus Limnocylindria bacterium]